jgi:hypothetical protein
LVARLVYGRAYTLHTNPCLVLNLPNYLWAFGFHWKFISKKKEKREEKEKKKRKKVLKFGTM